MARFVVASPGFHSGLRFDLAREAGLQKLGRDLLRRGIQVHNAFLIGLNWEKAATWQKLKDQKNALDALKQAIKTGAVDGELASVGELEAERLRLTTQLDREREALSNFRVLPQYREIEEQANGLTSEIHSFVNANIVDKRRLERYRDSLVSEDALKIVSKPFTIRPA